MAGQPPKRRKLSHSPSDNEEDAASFGSFGDSDNEQDGANAADKRAKSVKGQRQTVAAPRNDLDDGADGSEFEAEEEEEKPARTANPKLGKSQTTPKAAHARNGQTPASTNTAAYAGATFKSNMFKLQVDALLGQIRPKSGKKEAAAEAALHKIKDIIESIDRKSVV